MYKLISLDQSIIVLLFFGTVHLFLPRNKAHHATLKMGSLCSNPIDIRNSADYFSIF